MTGTATITATGHTVIIGYTAVRTERIISSVQAETDRELVLCAHHAIDTHPVPHLNVAFIRGSLTDDDSLRRAGVHRAARILIDVDDDNQALAVLVTAAHLNTNAHIVVAIHDLDRATQLSYVHSGVQCVLWHHPRMLAEELQDPGITRIYTELLTQGGGNTYSMQLPGTLNDLTAGNLQTLLGNEHGATMLGFDHQGQLHVSPPWQQPIPAGATIYYVARTRLTPEHLRPHRQLPRQTG
jgi:voltage-gated potassium channel